jgi:hypothetical protein
MALRTLIEPQTEPVTLADAKLYLRVDSSNTVDDALIASLITAARRFAEIYTRRRFLYQTVRLEMDYFPGSINPQLGGSHYAAAMLSGANAVLAGIRYAIVLPYPPVHHIAAFKYFDQNATVTDVTPTTQYVADLDSQPARLMPPFGRFWPVAQVIGNAVRVDFITGYGADIVVGVTASSAVLAGYTFVAEDVGSTITIQGAGAAGTALTTVIASVDNAGVGTLAVAASTTVAFAAAYLGKPVPAQILLAIKMLVNRWYELRLPDDASVPNVVTMLLGSYRDLRF